MTEPEFLEACEGRLPTCEWEEDPLQFRLHRGTKCGCGCGGYVWVRQEFGPDAHHAVITDREAVSLRYLQATKFLEQHRVEVVHLWAGAGQVWADGLFVASPNGWLTPRGDWSQQATERAYFADRFAATVAAIQAVRGEQR